MSVLIVFACLKGILDNRIYNDVLEAGTITKFLLVGSRAQDILFFPQALLLAFLCCIFSMSKSIVLDKDLTSTRAIAPSTK